jgi:amino acid transporter
MKKILLSLTVWLALLLAGAGILPGGTAYAACGHATDAKGQVLQGIGETGGDCSGSGLIHAVTAAVNILSLITGIAALIMIIVGGFKYITSGGDSNKVSNAKSTLIYALVGLFVAAVAQVLVHFVIHEADKAVGVNRSQQTMAIIGAGQLD